MRINTNHAAGLAARATTQAASRLGQQIEKLSSGYRINRGADDAAGLVVSQKLRAEISSLKVAVRNAQEGVNITQVIDGAYATIAGALQRRYELAMQYASTGTRTSADEAFWSDAHGEWEQLNSVFTSAGTQTKYGDVQLINGQYHQEFQVGIDAGQTIELNLDATSAGFLAMIMPVGVAFNSNIDDAGILGTLEDGIKSLSAIRGYVASVHNRLESTVVNLRTAVENLTASESRIRDTDMAETLVQVTRHRILTDASAGMLAQANRIPGSTLQLLL